jgi:type I restriction enzyme M protein
MEGDYSFNAKEADTTEEAGSNDDLAKSRWRVFSRDWIRDSKGDSLDISWLKDKDSVDAANLPEPEVLAAEAMSELTEALREMDGLMRALGAGDEADVQKQLLQDVLGVGSESA